MRDCEGKAGAGRRSIGRDSFVATEGRRGGLTPRWDALAWRLVPTRWLSSIHEWSLDMLYYGVVLDF